MELVAICQELWRRRIALAVAFVIALLAGMSVVYHLPSLKKKSLSYGAATTQFLLDSNKSSLANSGADLTNLATRAAVFTRFMTSPDVQTAIARHAGVPATRIEVDAPVDPGGPQGSTQPPAERRSSELASEADRYRIFVQNEQALPIVDVYAQAPDSAAAVKLADAAVAGIRDTLGAMQARQTIEQAAQLKIEQLGNPRGGVVTQNGSKLLAFVVFLFVFAIGCVLIVVGSRIVSEMQTGRPERERKPAKKRAQRPARSAVAAKAAARMAKAGAGRAAGMAKAGANGSSRRAESPTNGRPNGGSPPVPDQPSSKQAFVKAGRAGGGRVSRSHERGNGR
jgi:hypothetical protein